MKVKKQAERIKELLAKNLGRFLMGSVGLRGRARNLEHSVVSRSHSECRARIECTCFRASELRGQFPRLGPAQAYRFRWVSLHVGFLGSVGLTGL